MIQTDAFWKISGSEKPAFVFPNGKIISYEELAALIDIFALDIREKPGPIGILCDGSYHQYVAYLGALNAGCPVLLLQSGSEPKKISVSLRYLYDPATQELSTLSGSGNTSTWHPELAVLLSTSGSTGSSKWVRLSKTNIAANASSIAQYLSLGSDDRAPMALPFQYSYGMSVLNSHLAVGAAVVLTEGSVVDPKFWISFERTECTSLAGVPHSFELMEQARISTGHLDRLRYMTQAGGRLGPKNVRSWVERGISEGWDFFVMYGQTEASPRISYLPPEMALDTPSAIGVPIPGGEMWIADQNGERISDGEQGELWYRGPNTMMGYAQIDADLLKGQGSDVLKTGDVARRLQNGAFEIVGRMSRFVKLFGLRISLDEVESFVREAGAEAVCVAQDDRMYVIVTLLPGQIVAELNKRISDWLNIPAGSLQVIEMDTLPRHASGKVDLRAVEAIVTNFEAKKQPQSAPIGLRGLVGRFLPRRRESVSDVFRAYFPAASVAPEASFNSLGGDSLSYVAVSLELESLLGHLPKDWADLSLTSLNEQKGRGGWLIQLETQTAVRALAIMLIVAGHLKVFDYGGGGAHSLLVVAGMSFAAFTLPQVIQAGNVIPIATLALRLAAITLASTVLNFVVRGYGEWPALLFIGTWISPNVEGSVWFIEVYLQLLCGVMIVFSLPAVRRLTQNRVFFVASSSAVIFVALAAVSDLLVDTNHLYRRLPHLLAWIFLTGVAAETAKSMNERIVITALLLLGVWQFTGFQPIAINFFPLAALAMIWLPSITIPKILSPILRSIAGASLIIYLSHFQFASLTEKVIGSHPFLYWLVAIVGGVVAWRLYDPVDTWLAHRIRSLLTGNSSKRV